MVAIGWLLRIVVILAFHTYSQQTPTFDKSHLPITGEHYAFGFETGSIAGSIARGQGFSSPFGIQTGPTVWIAPVYPSLCAVVFKIFGLYSTASAIAILTINSFFGALTCIPIWLIAMRVFEDSRVGALAGWIWAISPFFMRWPTTWVWEVSLSACLLAYLIFLSLKAVEVYNRKTCILLGSLWGLASITNPALLGVMPITLIWIALRRRRNLRPYVTFPIAVAGICFAVMLPWLIRNRIVMGHFVFVRDNFGFELHMGNYHGSNGLGFGGFHPSANPSQLSMYTKMGELAYIKHSRNEAFRFIRDHPEEFGQLTLKRIVGFWDGGTLNLEKPEPWKWEPWEVLLLTVPAAFGLILSLFRRREGTMLLACVLFFYPTPYYITYAVSRYRHVIEPELLVLACFCACELMDHMKKRLRLRISLESWGAR